MESLDNILSGRGEAAPAPELQEAEVTQAEPETQAGPTETQSDDEPRAGMVPHQALHAERQKVKRYTEEVADFRKQLQETNAAWERRMAQVLEAVKPRETQQAPDFFENPAEATRHTVAPQFDQVNQALLANAQIIAGVKYGDEKVAEAEQAFITAMQSQKLDPADYQKVVNAPNRYAAAVQWHQRQLAQAEIGDDPAKYKEKLRAEIMEELKASGGQQTPPPVMPTNLAAARNVGSRSGPTWSGPPTLADIFKR